MKNISLATEAVKLAILNNGVAVVTLDLPDSKVNVLSSSMMQTLKAVIDEIKGNQVVRGLVIRSGKTDSFIAGADIREIKSLQKEPESQAYEAVEMGKAIFKEIDELGFNVVAEINGICLGGGTELALACDYRLASDNPKTKIGLPEVMLGVIPGWGGCVRLPRLIGLAESLPMILTGKTLDARKAWKVGLVSEVVEPEKIQERAIAVALSGKVNCFKAPFKAKLTRLALDGNPWGRALIAKRALASIMRETRGKMPAPLAALKVVVNGYGQPLVTAFESESRAFSRLAVGRVSRNLVGIWEAEQSSKRTPDDLQPVLEVKTVGVIGAGVMGGGIAQAAAYAGYNVVLFDIDPKALDAGMGKIKGLFSQLVDRRKLTQGEADKLYHAITPTTSYNDFAPCELVIEAIVEKMAVKKAAIASLEKAINKEFIFATNTSSLMVTEMASGARKPTNVVGLHFFNPVHLMPLVEIVKSKHANEPTSESVVAAVGKFAAKLGKKAVIVGDSPGFVVNRILAPFLREATVLFEEGVAPEDIEKAMVEFGMRMAPLATLDHVGLDIIKHVTNALKDQIGERLGPPAVMAQVDSLGLKGAKGGRGFYLYDEKGKPAGFNPDVLALITVPRKRISLDAIQDRLVLPMVNEAAMCLQEQVVEDPSQIDLALIYGTGFPPFLGGILRWADDTGVKVVEQKLALLSRVAGENYRPCQLLTEMAANGRNFYRE